LIILPSTFNKPNSTYYIKIDADFVRQNETLDALPGIPKYKWIFFTGIISFFLKKINKFNIYD